MEKFNRVVVVAPTRSTCLNISMVLSNGAIPETLLMREKRGEIFEAIGNLSLSQGGFGVVAGTGTGKTVAIRDIAGQVFSEKLSVDVVTREHEATQKTWKCNTLVVTPGVALNWFKSGVLSKDDLLIFDEIHQTSDHLELTMALAKRANCKFIWMSATIDPTVYSNYLDATRVIECSAFDPAKRSEVETSSTDIEDFLSSKVDGFVSEKRAVAVFVPTRALAENLSRKFNEKDGLHCDFYHGGEKAEKLRQFLKGDVPKPFMVFMTIAGASSLNILGLDTVVIMDQMYKEVVHSGVPVLEQVRLGNNELLQMGGRVNGRMENSEVYILTNRQIEFHNLKPTVPEFVLGGDLQRVALTCAKLGINAGDLDLIAPINQTVYNREVERFRDRGVIEVGSDNLTAYGKKVERLPVESSQAEMLVNAQQSDESQLLDVAIITSSVDQLFSLIRREPQLSDVNVSESDHLTSYNIIVSALSQFGYVIKSKNNGGGSEYGFKGNWFNKKYNKETKKTESQKGEFVTWCDEMGFNSKAIREATLAMKSVYRQLGVRLPSPESLKLIKSGDDLHKSFLNLLAKTQSLDFVCYEQNSKAGTVWAASHSRTSGNRVLGKIRHWTDRRGCQRATIEGTEIPQDLMEACASKKLVSIYRVTEEGVEIEFNSLFAGEKIGTITEVVVDSEVPVELFKQAERKFVDGFIAKKFFGVEAIIDNNRQVCEQSEFFSIRSGGAVEKISEADERALYESEFKGEGIISFQSYSVAIQEKNLLLNLEDFISAEKQDKILADNPEMIEVDGKMLAVDYGKDWDGIYSRVEVSESFVRKTEVEAIVLPSGRVVELKCQANSADSFSGLVEKLEGNRIEKCWSEKRSELEHTSWISDPEKVSPFFSKLLSSVEITRTNNDESDPIFGYFSLYSDSQLDFQIKLREDLEEAEKETKIGLGRLLSKSCRDEVTVPKEEPWYKKGSWSWNVTDLGQALETRLGELVIEYSKDLTSTNIGERIETFKQAVKTVKLGFEKEFLKKQNEEIALKEEAEVVKDQIRQAFCHSDKEKLSSGLREKLYGFYYNSVPSVLEEVRQWMTEAQDVYCEAEKGFKEIESKRRERRERGVNIPESLIQTFGDEDKAFAFMQKVAGLETSKLNEHIVCNCGRSKVQDHLVEVSGDEDFFIGADPNDVKFYVGDVHYYGHDGVPPKDEEGTEEEKTSELSEEERKAPPTADLMSQLLSSFGK